MHPHEPTFVVLDTNVWRSNYLLRSNLGAAILFWVNRGNVLIGLPEVVEEEILDHAFRAGVEASSEIRKSVRQLQLIMGSVDEINLPSEPAIERAVKSRLHGMSSMIERIPFTLEHARQALRRVNAKEPPNRRKQQFKDSAIWEAVVEVAERGMVHFVTEDKAFYKGHDYDQGIALELAEQCSQKGVNVVLHPDLAGCLRAIRDHAPEIDKDLIGSKLAGELREHISNRSSLADFELGELRNADITPFVIEDPNKLAIDYEVTFEASGDPAVLDLVPEIAVIEGSALYDPNEERLLENDVSFISFLPPGSNAQQGHRVLRLKAEAGVFGKRQIPYSIRYEIK